MDMCIACGEKKSSQEIIMNAYKEPICIICEKEIREEAIEAMKDICR
jgi:hypothetical protein